MGCPLKFERKRPTGPLNNSESKEGKEIQVKEKVSYYILVGVKTIVGGQVWGENHILKKGDLPLN